MKSSLLAVVACLALPQAGLGAASVEILDMPDDCKSVAQPGDHLMLRMTVQDASSNEELYATQSFQAQHVELGHESISDAFTEGLIGVCRGEVRKLTFPAEVMKGKGPNMDDAMRRGAATLQATVEVLELTSMKDYAIFDFLQNEQFDQVLGMIDEHTGTNAVDQWGASPLMVAIQTKAQLVVASLLNTWRPKVDVNFAKASGHTALFYCIAVDNAVVLKALLKRGADPNTSLKQPDSLGWTPLHFACKFHNVKHAQLLLDFGADPLAETATGMSVLDAAAGAQYSVRKKLADILNEAVERMEVESNARADL